MVFTDLQRFPSIVDDMYATVICISLARNGHKSSIATVAVVAGGDVLSVKKYQYCS